MSGKIYLIPTTLGESEISNVIPDYVKSVINKIDEFIVENEKSARHYLKKAGINKPLQEVILKPLNKHTSPEEYTAYLKPTLEGKNIGIISEAGCPAIADPGSEIVKLAHQKNIEVIPLVGPSSILLSLMASGFNGQNFSFNGYLPIDKNERSRKIKELEKLVQQKNQTQLFIETPFRNNALIADLINNCNGNTLLCIACDITLPTEFIKTKSIADWKKSPPDIHKRPAIFLLGN